MNDPKDHATIDAITNSIQDVTPNVELTVTYKEKQGNAKVTRILTKVFMTIIAITMFLCFFSLSASMTSNLYE